MSSASRHLRFWRLEGSPSLVAVHYHWTVSMECGVGVWSWNLLGCVPPSQCQHPGTHQSPGWTSQRPKPAGCSFHERSGRPRLQSGWVQLLCGSDQSGPPGMSYCREGASNTRHTPISAYRRILSEMKSSGNNLFNYGMIFFRCLFA